MRKYLGVSGTSITHALRLTSPPETLHRPPDCGQRSTIKGSGPGFAGLGFSGLGFRGLGFRAWV